MKYRLLGWLLLLPLLLMAQERPKVAVVLSGGGAKGTAHIGALKVIEKAGIPIDYVVGTSMGAIVGGLYAIGYTPEQLDSMVMRRTGSSFCRTLPILKMYCSTIVCGRSVMCCLFLLR